jgi:hypothetical protein
MQVSAADELLRVIEILALAFDPVNITAAEADAIDVLAEMGAGDEDFDQDDGDADDVEDRIDTICRINRLAKRNRFKFGPVIANDSDDESDDWDNSRADSGPDETPADFIGDDSCVSLFFAPDVAEQELHDVLQRRLRGYRYWSWRADNIGTLNGKSVRFADLRRSYR